MNRIRTAFLLAAAACAWAGSSQAQRVGVVMSGGGAKGLYHIGVLQALEEHGIPIDYVSGTSMGSIVAGLYAAGYSPEEMTAICTPERMQRWVSGKIDEKYSLYFKHMEPNAAMLTIRLNVGRHRAGKESGVVLPKNLLSSTQIDLGMMEYFTPASVAACGNFDSLMVPFRCVAADMVHRRPVTFARGDLGEAIRASMSIPFVFKPIRMDSMLLYDGGIYDNFPWKPLEERFEPDYLIGSKCTAGNTTPDENSLLDQAFALFMQPTDYRLPPNKSVMIEHVFDDVNMLDFARASYIIQTGYEDAQRMIPQILSAVERRMTPGEYEARRAAFRARTPPLVFDAYRIEGLTDAQTEYVRDYMQLDGADGRERVYTFERLRDEYFKVLSEGNITADYPRARYSDSTHRYAVHFDLAAKSDLKLMIGGNISSTALNQAYVGLEYRTIGRVASTQQLNLYLSPFHTLINVGGRIEFSFRRPVFFDYGAYFNIFNYDQNNNGSLRRQTTIRFAKTTDHFLRLGIGMPLGRKSVVLLTAHIGQEGYRYFQGAGFTDDDRLDRTRFPFAAAQIEGQLNSLNRTLFPTRGVGQSLSGIFVLGRERYKPGTSGLSLGQMRMSGKRHWFGARFRREQYFALPSVRWFALGYLVEGVFSNHPAFSNLYSTSMSAPAFTPTPHSRIVYLSEYRADAFAAAGVVPILEFMPNFYLRLSAYGFYPVKDRSFNQARHVRFIFDGSLVYQTLIGPVSLSLSRYDTADRDRWFLSFNFGYAIFGRKGLYY